MSVPTRFPDVAAAMFANGYRPVPIMPGTKHPDLDSWQHFIFTPGCQRRFPRHGAGILLGDVVAIDIDVSDPDAAAACENVVYEVLGLSEAAEIPRRIGRAPKLMLLLACDEPFSKMVSAAYKMRSNGSRARVEILANGQQAVAYGIHPETHQPYTWNGGGDPLTVKQAELIVIDEAKARELIAACEAALDEWGDRVTEPNDGKRGATPDEKIVGGERNEVLFKFGCKLARERLTVAEIEAALLAVNAARCAPPLSEDEVRKIAQSAGKYAPEPDADNAKAEPGGLLGTIYTGTALLETAATPTRWLVEGWVSEGASVLIGAHGGTGKSWLALQASACFGVGHPFLGLTTQRRRTLLYAAEDRADVLRWRLRSVCNSLNIDSAALDENLIVIDQSRKPAELMGRDRYGVLGFAPLFEVLANELRKRRIEVLVIDSASDAFGGNEIARAEVRRYICEMQRLVPDTGAVLHVVHVDKAHARGLARGQGYSGSTAWHNSVRQRWELTSPADEDEDGGRRQGDPADPRRVLLLAKNNYGPPGAELALRFDADAGIFVAEAPATPGGVVDSIDRRNAERAVLCFLLEAEAAGKPVHAAERANENAYRRMQVADKLPKRFASRRGRKALFDLLLRWRDEGLIEEFEVKRQRQPVRLWRVTDAGKARVSASTAST